MAVKLHEELLGVLQVTHYVYEVGNKLLNEMWLNAALIAILSKHRTGGSLDSIFVNVWL
jgi:hypothetical protein